MSTANRKARPARRNSLQRMLELERRYMMERLQSSGTATQTKTAGGRPVVPPSTRNVFATNQHPVIQAYRAVGQTQTDLSQGARSHVFEAAPRLPPLTIDTKIAKSVQEADEKVGATKPEDSILKIQALPEKLASKIVSFYIPTEDNEEDRKSICQSPSWEAYGRRKKEKTEEKKDSKRDLKKDVKKDVKDQKKEKETEKAKKKQKEKEDKDKERENEKEKEKEKEEASKTAVVKKKRLSKTPPTSSANAIDQANRLSRSGPSPSLDQPRPSSETGSPSPIRDERAQRRPRSRSSSISSLFRRPFEPRRSSTEEIAPVETGFIGGIKLEMERHATMQKNYDEQQKPSKEDEGNIHPALRVGNKSDMTTHLGTKSTMPGNKTPDPQRRAYPPITRLTSPTKNRPPMTTATSMPDAGTMQKWRAFVGMKSTAKQGTSGAKVDAITTSAADTAPRKAQQSPQSPQSSQATRAIESGSQGPKLAKSLTAPQLSIITGINDAQVRLLTPKFAERLTKTQAQAQAQQVQIPRKEVGRQEITIQTNQRASDGTLPKPSPPCFFIAPPEPPERSPKRASVQSLVDLAPTLGSPTERPSSQSARRPGSSNASVSVGAPNGKQSPQFPPNSRLNSSHTSYKVDGSRQRHSYSGSDTRDSVSSGLEHFASSGASLEKGNRPESARVTSWEDIKSSVAQAIADNVSLSPVRKSQSFLRDDSDFTVRRLSHAQVPTSSLSDECSTDEFHSPSAPGTPDTSRPQSEKGAPPVFSDIEQRLMSQGEGRPHPQPQNSQSTIKEPVSNKIPRVVVDLPEHGRVKVVNAATEVLHMPQGRSIAQIRVTSESGGLPETNFLPKLKHQPLKPAEKQTPASRQNIRASPSPSKEKMLMNQPPWPASYLEEARKATPLAPPPQALKSPSLPSKASLRTPELSVRTHPSSSTISHSAASSYATPTGDPVAKMFVECCGCKYYHDMPSNLYEVMANPDAVIPTRNTSIELSGLVTMTVRCPWCNHDMNTKCCAGYVAMVYLKQRLH